MSITHPVYAVRLSGASNWLGEPYNFGTTGVTNKVSSIRVKPGLTSAVGTFEVDFPDTGSSGNAFTGISLFDHVWIWLNYNSTGSFPPTMQGRIDTLETDFSESRGYLRKLIGRDYGEALLRILERRSFTGSTSGSMVILNDDASLNTNHKYIINDTTPYTIVMENKNVHSGMVEISDFNNKDFYVDEQKQLHWFIRQTGSGTHAFVVGQNILSYRVFNDISDCSNKIYVFGGKDSSWTGSYRPQQWGGTGVSGNYSSGLDIWTEEGDEGNWTGLKEDSSGSYALTPDHQAGHYTGSSSIYVEWNSDTAEPVSDVFRIHLRRLFSPPLMLSSDDFMAFAFEQAWGTLSPLNESCTGSQIRLRSGNWDADYFYTELEPNLTDANHWQYHPKLPLGPKNEGVTVLTTYDQNTGSYKWLRSGSPDWFNIDGFECIFTNYLDKNWSANNSAVDALYFATRFQGVASSSASQASYGLREKIIKNDRYNSNQYCQNVANTYLSINSSSTRQIEILTTGSIDLVMGYLYPLTIPSEGLSASNLELIDLEHKFDGGGFTTKCLFTDKKEITTPIPLINYPVQNTFSMKAFKEQMDRETTYYYSILL